MPRASAGAASSADRVGDRIERLAEQLLDAREIDDAFAQHGLGDLPELRIDSAPGAGAPGGMIRRTSASSRPSSTPISVAAMSISVSCSAGARRADDVGEARQLALHLFAHRSQAEHRERVADLLQHVDLRREFLRRPALARVEIERVLDAAEVLLDRRGDRAHQAHRRRRQRFAFLLDRLVDRQQFVQPE